MVMSTRIAGLPLRALTLEVYSLARVVGNLSIVTEPLVSEVSYFVHSPLIFRLVYRDQRRILL